MLHILPVEVIVDILSFLPLGTLAGLYTLSKSTKLLLDVNETTIYRNAAFYHSFVDSKDCPWSYLEDSYSKRALMGVDTWKAFCQARIHTHQAWRGRRPSTVKTFLPDPEAADDVHRIKVDERAGIVITSFRGAGVTVSDLESGLTLWALPNNYVEPFAHIEYENGFMIFNMHGRRKEVWRLVGSHPDLQPPEGDRDGPQQRQSRLARSIHRETYPRGHFEAWAALKTPALTSAFRFIYPNLLAATRQRIFIYDVRSAELVKDFTISDSELEVQTHLTYVELSSRYFFLCGYPSVRVVSRETGRVLLDIRSDHVVYSDAVYTLSKDATVAPGSALAVHNVYTRTPRYPRGLQQIYDQFSAVHVSPCGRHLAIMSMTSRLLIIPYFERLFSSRSRPTNLTDIVIEVELGSRARLSRYLAFDGIRAAVATETGVYIVHLPDFDHPDRSPPSVSRVVALDRPHALAEVSCLQMTDTALWVTWKYPYPELEDEPRPDYDAYLDEEITYHVFNQDVPVGSIDIRPVLGEDGIVEATLQAVCMVDFAMGDPSQSQEEVEPDGKEGGFISTPSPPVASEAIEVL